MNKQTLVVIVGAALLFGVGIIGAVAFTGGDDSPMMTMPDGSTMPNGQMTGTTTMMDMNP